MATTSKHRPAKKYVILLTIRSTKNLEVYSTLSAAARDYPDINTQTAGRYLRTGDVYRTKTLLIERKEINRRKDADYV